MLIVLPGCVGGGMDLFGEKVDRSVATSTIGVKSTDTRSDELTISNAVTSADVNKLQGRPIPWANTSTGSAGVITAIAEDKQSGGLCRQFRTTRHSYQGIANFDGKACVAPSGEWQLLSFQPTDTP